MINNSGKIEKYLNEIGQKTTAYIQGEEFCFKAVFQKFRDKNRTNLEPKWDYAGAVDNEYASYIGPSSFDITKMMKDDYFIFQGEKYEPIKKSAIVVGDETQYFIATLKKVREYEYK